MPDMPYAAQLDTSDGVQTDFALSINYLDRSHIYVSVDNIDTGEIDSLYTFSWINSTTIRVITASDSSPVPAGLEVKIYRKTPIAEPSVVFGSEVALTSKALNTSVEYLTYALQELADDNTDFNTLYLGPKAVEPSTDNDGNTLRAGALFFNTERVRLLHWDGTSWVASDQVPTALQALHYTREEFMGLATDGLPDGTTLSVGDRFYVKASGTVAGEADAPRDDWEPACTFSTVAAMLQSRQPADVGSIFNAGGFRYEVVTTGAHLTRDEGSLQLRLLNRKDFTPEAFRAAGDTDTDAWNKMLRAAVAATADGPVNISATRGEYTVDELDHISQYAGSGSMPVQQDSIFFNLKGVKLIHSGVGDGILSVEGNGNTRYQTNLNGGQFIAHANTKWLTRSRDLRTSQWNPEMLGSTGSATNTIGHLSEIWRTWSENMTFGMKGMLLELRKLAHGLVFAKRSFSWALEAYWTHPEYFTSGTTNLGTWSTDAKAIAGKGSAAVEGDYYYQVHEDGYKGYRVFNGTSWVHAMNVRGDIWAWTDGVYATADPVGVDKGYLYFNTDDNEVRVFDGSSWHTLFAITGVDVSLSASGAESFARNSVYDVVYAACYDPSYDGIGILCLGAAPYDSRIDGGQGNVANGGGSLIYLNGNYFYGTIIENYGLEKANDGAQAISSLIRVGPETAVALNVPRISNISWTGGYAYQCDPDAGFVFTGEMTELVSVTADTASPVLSAGLLKPNTVVEVTLKNNANTITTRAVIYRKNATDAVEINDQWATREFIRFSAAPIVADTAFTQLDGNRFLAPRSGSLLGMTAITNSPVTAGQINTEPRITSGDLNATGGNPGLDATITAGEFLAHNFQSNGLDTFDAGDSIYVLYETDAAFVPGNAGADADEVQVTVEVLLNGIHAWGTNDGGDITLTPAVSESNLRVMLRVLKG